MFLLITSVLALALGPLLYRMADAARSTLLALDGFVMVTISGLVLVHIIPHSIAVAGPMALVLALLGFFGPGVIEHNLHRAARQAHIATLILACVGLLVHAFFDGVALGAAGPSAHGHGHDDGSVLAIAVALHRLPVAITIWWLLRPSSGVLTAAATLTGLGIATIAGFAFAPTLEPLMSAEWLGMFQSLVAGSLLHVVIHRPPPLSAPSSAGRGRIYAGVGAIAGLAVVAMLADTHLPFHGVPGSMNFRETFLTLTLASAPALLLGFLLAGLVKAYLPQASMRWMRTGRPVSESVRGMAFGLPLPICSCGVMPVYRSLILHGAPATAGMAFLVATPELGLDAVLISLPLLGAELTIARVVAAAVVAFTIGILVGRMADRAQAARAADQGGGGPQMGEQAPAVVHGGFWARLTLGIRFGLGEVVDDVGPWLLLGLVIASLVEPMLDGQWFAVLPWGVDVLLFALLGMPTYVCASGATPLVAVLIHKGVSPGAALAFLLAGPATNISTFGVLADMHGRRIALAFAGAIAVLATGLGLVVNLALADVEGLALHESVYEEPGLVSMAALAVLTAAFAVSVLRLGPRGFVAQVFAPHSEGDPCNDDCHDHDDHGDGGSAPAEASGCASASCCSHEHG